MSSKQARYQRDISFSHTQRTTDVCTSTCMIPLHVTLASILSNSIRLSFPQRFLARALWWRQGALSLPGASILSRWRGLLHPKEIFIHQQYASAAVSFAHVGGDSYGPSCFCAFFFRIDDHRSAIPYCTSSGCSDGHPTLAPCPPFIIHIHST
jgi:hypothetical protein